MKKLTTFLIIILLLVPFITDVHGQLTRNLGPALPEPVFPLRDTGQNVEQIQKIISAIKAKKVEEYVPAIYLLKDSLIGSEIERNKRKEEISKAEFATREWLTYCVCSIPLPSVEEIWKTDLSGRFSFAYGAMEWLSRCESNIIESMKTNQRTFYKNRVIYVASLLRDLKIEEEVLAKEMEGIQIREILSNNAGLRKDRELHVFNPPEATITYPSGSELEDRWRIRYMNFQNHRIQLEKELHTLRWQIGSYEDDLFRFLLNHQKHLQSDILSYLRMAGYDTEEKIGAVYFRVQKRIQRSGDTEELFYQHIKKKGYSFRTFEKHAEEEKKTIERRISGYRKYWEGERIKAETESKKLRGELERDRSEYLKNSNCASGCASEGK